MHATCEADVLERFDVDTVWNGLRLREIRKAAGLTQSELAHIAGTKQNNISRWEDGSQEPQWSVVVGLAKALGVKIAAFDEPVGTPVKPKYRKPAPPADETVD